MADFFLGPDEGLGFFVVGVDEGIDVFLQLLKAGKGSATKRLTLQDGEPIFDLIELGCSCRREMKVHPGVLVEPTLILLMGVEVIENDVEVAAWKSRDHAVHEPEKFNATAPLRMCCNDLPGGDFEGSKQRRRAVALVIVALARQRAAVGQLQVALRPLQRLDRRLLVHAQHDGLLGRSDIEANNIGGFAVKSGSLLSHQDLRAARSILW